MNDDALIELGAALAEKISKKRGEKITLGRIVDWSDSYHIYGQVFEDFLDRFGKNLIKRHFISKGEHDVNARTWNSDSELVQEIFKEVRMRIPEKIRAQDKKYAEREDLTKDSFKLFKKEKI